MITSTIKAAYLVPRAARDLRAAIEGRSLDMTAIRSIDATCTSERDVQSHWIAIARRPELASCHALPIARALLADDAVSHRAWMVDITTYRGPWLRGGFVAVAWSAGGLGKLGWQAKSMSIDLGVLPSVPDVEHIIEGGPTWRVELKTPGKMGARGRRIGVGKVGGAQAVMLETLSRAGHPSSWATSVEMVALEAVRVLTNECHRPTMTP